MRRVSRAAWEQGVWGQVGEKQGRCSASSCARQDEASGAGMNNYWPGRKQLLSNTAGSFNLCFFVHPCVVHRSGRTAVLPLPRRWECIASLHRLCAQPGAGWSAHLSLAGATP